MKQYLRWFSHILLYLAATVFPFHLMAQVSDGLHNDTLTLSGTGAMKDYNFTTDPAPWYSSAGNIKAVVIEEGITSIGNWAFWECTQLASVAIPGTVTRIGMNAFEDCQKLASVTIPQNVTEIGNKAFRGSSILRDVKVKRTTPITISGDVFGEEGETGDMHLIVPRGSRQAYSEAEIWKTFDEIDEVKLINDATVTVEVAGDNVYSGSPLKPAVTVKYGDDVLTKNDCSHRYSNNINAGQATVTVTGLFRYEGDTTVYFTIAKASPDVTWPGKAEIEEGQALSEARFTGGSGNGIFAFVNGGVIPALSDSETTLYELVFTPADAANYKEVKNDMKVVVNPRPTGYSDHLFSEIVIYPNPFAGEIHLKGATDCTLRVLNVVGVVVHTRKITTFDETIQLDHVPAGLYFFRLEKGGKTKTVKVGKR